MQISFLNPGNPSDPFYGRMARFMILAADALGIDLEIVDCDRDPLLVAENAERLLSRAKAPEYLLMANDQGAAEDLLPKANAKGTKVLLINQGLLSVEKMILGQPRQQLASWLGELLPDDYEAGRLLARSLAAAAKKHRLADHDGRIQVLGLGGTYTVSSLLRINGLRKAVQEDRDVSLHSVAPAHWEYERAKSVVAAALRDSPEISVVWAASDLMALGALQAIEEAGRSAGRDILVGGIDWSPAVLPKIRDGVLTASVGGHFMDGAWAVIKLYDYHHGHDLAPVTAATRFAVLCQETAGLYAEVFDEVKWRDIDFPMFSKVHNRDLKDDDFSVETILTCSQRGSSPARMSLN